MWLRAFLFALLVIASGRLIRRFLRQILEAQTAPPIDPGRPRGRDPRQATGDNPVPIAGGRMVRDRICDTFIPESSALTLRHDGQTHYFCSTTCRDRFLALDDTSRETVSASS